MARMTDDIIMLIGNKFMLKIYNRSHRMLLRPGLHDNDVVISILLKRGAQLQSSVYGRTIRLYNTLNRLFCKYQRVKQAS